MLRILNKNLIETDGTHPTTVQIAIGSVLSIARQIVDKERFDLELLYGMREHYWAGAEFADRLDATTLNEGVLTEMQALWHFFTSKGGKIAGLSLQQRYDIFVAALNAVEKLPDQYITTDFWVAMDEYAPINTAYALHMIRSIMQKGYLPRKWILTAKRVADTRPYLWQFTTTLAWNDFSDGVIFPAVHVHKSVRTECSVFWRAYEAVGGILVGGTAFDDPIETPADQYDWVLDAMKLVNSLPNSGS